jgi:hypothetical protein
MIAQQEREKLEPLELTAQEQDRDVNLQQTESNNS